MKKPISDDQLLVDVTNAAITYGEGLEAGDDRKANKAYAVANKAFEELVARGAEQRVLDLLEFAHPAVRLVAAAFAMRFAPERGEPVLEKIANGPKGGIRAMASTSLYFWRRRPKEAAA